MTRFQPLVKTKIEELISEDVLRSGIDRSIFDGINHVKKSILDIISNNEASDEECAKLIKLLIDSTFKEIINAVF